MAFTIKTGTFKNFMSIGAVSQAINFSSDELTLVLGENLDLGGNDSRNGVGKSTILNGLSYALYGEALVKIKKDNLVNKVNQKGMMVTLEFEKDGIAYKIERGRKPNVFKFYANGREFGEDTTDEAQGDSRLTQQEIERVIGISHTMFKNIVALNTYNEPFLSMRNNDQRAIIEQLLGITKLSDKADLLKEQAKRVRDSIKEEEYRIKAIEASNKQIENSINSLKIKSTAWDKSKAKNISEIEASLKTMIGVDIDAEIANHKANDEVKKKLQEKKAIESEISVVNRELKLYNRELTSAQAFLSKTHESDNCPTCNQSMDTGTHEKLIAEYQEKVDKAQEKINEKEPVLAELTSALEHYTDLNLVSTFYTSIEDAYGHKNTVDTLANELEKELGLTNPFDDQIKVLEEQSLQEVDFSKINDLTDLKNHQDFLLKLLTNKDSFIRKKIIDQNLAYLNSRLSHFLEKVGLPHEVKFKSDLEVEITQYGRDFDFDNLSRGERTRLILSLSWAFRDVYESLNDKINLLFIDELIDSGLDTNGVEAALKVLKNMNRDNARNIYLISHRDELIGRVTNVLKVVKESGFTSFSDEDTQI